MERNKLSNSGSKKMEGGKSRCTVLAFLPYEGNR